jgi:colanic acid biosynthesis glycosyl transferase WcaI
MAKTLPANQIIVAISQVYPPGPTSLGQHMADATGELARRGHQVTVYTANRDYADPSVSFASREMMQGVDVRRLPLSSFGKRSMLARLAGGIAFLFQAVWRALFLHRIDVVLVSTSPPMAGFAGLLVAKLRHARLVYWVMDLNPDQAIAQGVVAPDSVAVRAYDWMNRAVLRRADAVVAMDRFMAARLNGKHSTGTRMHVIAPWPHEEEVTGHPQSLNVFRRNHALTERFVVMYSGNHSAANPLRTMIDAAIALRDDPSVIFVFVGAGTEKAAVEAAGGPNILSLPYQPMHTLADSLGAADLHVVTMGDDMVGIVHPCKVYGALAASRPILFVGPALSHVADLLARTPVGWHIRHGDVNAAVDAIRAAAAMSREERAAMGARAKALITTELSKSALCGAFCDVVDASASASARPHIAPRDLRARSRATVSNLQ